MDHLRHDGCPRTFGREPLKKRGISDNIIFFFFVAMTVYFTTVAFVAKPNFDNGTELANNFDFSEVPKRINI